MELERRRGFNWLRGSELKLGFKIVHFKCSTHNSRHYVAEGGALPAGVHTFFSRLTRRSTDPREV